MQGSAWTASLVPLSARFTTFSFTLHPAKSGGSSPLCFRTEIIVPSTVSGLSTSLRSAFDRCLRGDDMQQASAGGLRRLRLPNLNSLRLSQMPPEPPSARDSSNMQIRFIF